jgi:hypothetical protein
MLDRVDAAQRVFYGGEGNLNDIIYGASGGSNLTVTNSYLHDTNWFAAVLLINWNEVVFDGNYFANNYRKEILSCRECTNLTWRNSIHNNAAGTGYLVGQNPINWHIYNNVFFNTDSRYTTTDCIFCNWYGQGMSAQGIYIYGNTFYNVLGAATIGYDGATNVVAMNNISYGGEGVSWHGDIKHDYNWCYSSGGSCAGIAGESHGELGSVGVFVDPAAEDFRLRAPTSPGVALPAPYDNDLRGVNRASGGTWDRGAYSFFFDVAPDAGVSDSGTGHAADGVEPGGAGAGGPVAGGAGASGPNDGPGAGASGCGTSPAVSVSRHSGPTAGWLLLGLWVLARRTRRRLS